MLGSHREKYDVSDADVEAGGDSGENNSDLLQWKDQYSTICSVLIVDKYTVTAADSGESAFALRLQSHINSHCEVSSFHLNYLCTECKTPSNPVL